MRVAYTIMVTMVLALYGAPARAAGFEQVADGLKAPDSPRLIGNQLYWVEYTGDSVMRLNGGAKSVFFTKKGCGPSGIAELPGDRMIVACNLSNEVITLDREGKVLDTVASDSEGRPFANPNDFALDERGGVYMTASGPWEEKPTAVLGGVFYRAPGTGPFVRVADDLAYGNGVAVDKGGKALFVAETLTDRIYRYDIGADGHLSGKSLFAWLPGLVPDTGTPTIWRGPDAIRTDQNGNLLVAYYLGGTVLKISPQGQLETTYVLPTPAVTSMTLTAEADAMFVTGYVDLTKEPYFGTMWRVPLAK